MNWLREVGLLSILAGSLLVAITLPSFKLGYLPNPTTYLYTGIAVVLVGAYFYIVNNKKDKKKGKENEA